MTIIRDFETATLNTIESAELTEEQRYTIWLLVIVRQLLIERNAKGLENWSIEEIIQFAKKICEDVRPLPH
jgi:hypothetical protein